MGEKTTRETNVLLRRLHPMWVWYVGKTSRITPLCQETEEMSWNAYRDCPHEGFCLTKKECMKNEKRKTPTRDGSSDTRSYDIREQWFDPAFGDEGDE